MVAKIMTGKSIKGALNYNEKKVSEGKAALLDAVGFPAADEMLFSEKLSRFQRLTEQNTRTIVNTVHISLNFDASEKLSKETLLAITDAYIGGIGFAGQPYLLYQHFDAAHPHLHIVTTNIKDGGERISLHHLGIEKSETARKEIEKLFGLVVADGRKKSQNEALKPIVEKVIYGKSETKAAVSNVVRAIVRDYKFTSLQEFNTLLERYNVTAYRGEEGSKMFDKKGLSYFVLDAARKKIGVPIKASSIYTKPTFSNLEKLFDTNKNERLRFKEPLKNTIDKVLQSKFIPTKEAFKSELEKRNIDVVFHQNETMVYGITFIDHNTKTVFNGSDLGKAYSAKRLMERIGMGGLAEQKERKENKEFVEKVLSETDYTRGISHAIASLYAQGLRIHVVSDEEENLHYAFGKQQTEEHNFVPADRKFDAWFRNKNISASVVEKLNEEVERHTENSVPLVSFVQHFTNFLKEVLTDTPNIPSFSMNTDPKKKKKRKPNW
ncbi:hypothetical protein A9P82_08020 [Arachidicoccus ginsenosidimutans]|uniref:relaxase/mobilization nuclease domain-containing protein n=1 Tax=Arachidicoccus sp. BS20 TaxID=1850526 RepID=UPI0007F0BF73|nr:relaxase/mobilization nuclease domain-containing protein [Arachidicoccus sp. BS20]ANI89241.1 hypothetical protein A9P82_08020 [Arachidicoccus sp. BS20]